AFASMTVGTVLQNAMPVFGNMLAGATDPDLMYGYLLFALGAGAVLGGLALEVTGWVQPNVRAVVGATITLGVFAALFSLTRSPAIALGLLFLTGISHITAESVGMAIVQLEAPRDQRGRVIGSYSMFGPGMRSFSGVIVGALGAFMGLPATVFAGGVILAVATIVAVGVIRPGIRQS
ncbi:MAG TPA: MFS transporter, partial [Beutenbergiaceae bacterium]|nr:MFS transporter [Beutenbergiaceae bacterium]